MIENVKNMTEEVLEAMKPKVLQGLPNTYTFSKALSEELVRKSGLPAGIARPSIGKQNFYLIKQLTVVIGDCYQKLNIIDI